MNLIVYSSSDEVLELLIEQFALVHSIRVEKTQLKQVIQGSRETSVEGADEDWPLFQVAHAVRLRLGLISCGINDLVHVLEEGIPVAFRSPENREDWWLFSQMDRNTFRGVRISSAVVEEFQIGRRELGRLLAQKGLARIDPCYIAQPFLECQRASTGMIDGHADGHASDGHTNGSHGHGSHAHLSPLRRLWRLIGADWQDILSLVIYGFTAGILGLASPLAVEWVVTTIGFGRYLQPLFVLALLLFAFLMFAGAMRVLQGIVVEIMQRRLMVRIAGDLAYRLPHVRQESLHGADGRELLNRFLDVPTIQKAVATLLLDGITLVLSTITGMILLAFYHPFLLGFDLILLLSMTLITYFLGRGGLRTAIQESITKYKITSWLQEVVSHPTAFRLQGGLNLSLDRANRLTSEYVAHRRQHFFVLMRQILFAVSLQAVALTALIALGGWLVIQGQLTLGQWVASELVIGVIVGGFAKIGKSLEIFFDLLAAVDKVGHLLDLQIVPPSKPIQPGSGPASIRWRDLQSASESHGVHAYGSGEILPGKRVQLVAEGSEVEHFIELLIGLREPVSGFLEVEGIDARDAARNTLGRLVGIATDVSIFDGTLQENIALGRPFLRQDQIRWALDFVGLTDWVHQLPQGIDTELGIEGKVLNRDEAIRLMIARAIVAKPRVLVIGYLLDGLSASQRGPILSKMIDPNMPWTLVVATHHAILGQEAETVRWTHSPA